MAIEIHLEANPAKIPQNDWTRVYQESLQILKAFPAPLICLKEEEISGHKRYYYTDKIEINRGTSQECWEICGDMTTLKLGENFRLYKNLAEQEKKTAPEKNRDILWAPEEKLDYQNGCGILTLSGKTKGAPYHLAVLATTLLFASRFPGQCYLYGDIEEWQVNRCILWINRILSNPIFLPAIFNGHTLWKRLEKLYTDPRHVITRFKTLYKGTDLYGQLLVHSDRDLIKEYVIGEIEKYENLHHYGASRIIEEWLNTTSNVTELIEMICIPEGQRKFSLKQLLKFLCDKQITYPPKKKSTPPKTETERLVETEDQMPSCLSHINGSSPEGIKCHIPGEDLLALFTEYDCDNREKYKKIILQVPRPPRKNPELPAGNPKNHTSIQDPDDFIKRELIPDGYSNLEEGLEDTAAKLKTFYTQNSGYIDETVDFNNRRDLTLLHMDLSQRGNVALTEKSWKIIDSLPTGPELKALTILFFVANRTPAFHQWRFFLLEHPEHWLTLAKYFREPQEE